MLTIHSEVFPSQSGGTSPLFYSPEIVFDIQSDNNLGTWLTKILEPRSIVTGLSVFSLIVKYGTYHS